MIEELEVSAINSKFLSKFNFKTNIFEIRGISYKNLKDIHQFLKICFNKTTIRSMTSCMTDYTENCLFSLTYFDCTLKEYLNFKHKVSFKLLPKRLSNAERRKMICLRNL